MSAIDKDREMYAAARNGKSGYHPGQWLIRMMDGPSPRQPKYDAAANLVVALAEDHEQEARSRYQFNSQSAYASIDEWRRDHATECDACRVAIDLEREKP